MEWKPQDADKDAAWELYVELLTRITTQALPVDQGTEETALASIHSLFKTTRDILKSHGRQCIAFSKVAVVVLNQVIRPFTAALYQILESRSCWQPFPLNILLESMSRNRSKAAEDSQVAWPCNRPKPNTYASVANTKYLGAIFLCL